MEIAKYTESGEIKEDKCWGVRFMISDYAGEAEAIELNNDNCKRFEEHPRFFKIIYKPFKERFIVKEQVISEGITVMTAVVDDE